MPYHQLTIGHLQKSIIKDVFLFNRNVNDDVNNAVTFKNLPISKVKDVLNIAIFSK